MKTILVIDDEEFIRFTLRKLLEGDGYNIIEAGDGIEGMDLYKNNHVDLIITDIIMPEKEGIETINELKKKYPDVKIVAMSGGGRIGPEAYLEMARDFGASLTIRKPIVKNELINAVKELIG